jgi:hypothetical protein
MTGVPAKPGADPQRDPRTWIGAPGYPCPCAGGCSNRTPAPSTPCLPCGAGFCRHDEAAHES